jgi:hypothetical protein
MRPSVDPRPDCLTATVTFVASGAIRAPIGYAPRRPAVTAQTGSLGELDFDAVSGRFEVTVSPGPQ